MNAGDIARMLAAYPLDICRHLLPAGKDKHGEWCVGSLDGEEGESLKVRLTGPRAGLWADFAHDGESGDLLDLWAKVKGVSVSEAMKEAAQYLGVSRPRLQSRPIPTVKPPRDASKATSDAGAWKWLTEARKLPEASLTAYRVGAHKGAVAFPAFTPDGKAVQYIKYRDTQAKKFWSAEGGEPCLFGWQAIPPEAREVCLVEGEMDAVAMHAYGWPALSPTNGAGNLGWIEAEYENLARFDRIYIAFDMDDAGQSVVAKIAERVGNARCLSVSLPHKDANACLLAGVDGEDIEACFKAAQTFDPPELLAVSDCAEDVIRLFRDAPAKGVALPWDKTAGLFRFGPGELTVLAGRNNSGKSQLCGQLTLAALKQGQRACIASMEFAPVRLMARMDIQAGAMRDLSDDYIRAIHKWYADKLWAFGVTGTAKVERIMDVFSYAAARYGVRWFVIDNLAKCGIDEDDHNAQKGFVDRLGDFARLTDSHVTLVHHIRKGEGDQHLPQNSDVKGTGAITDMADNVLLLWRDRKKEQQREMALKANAPFDNAEKPDAVLTVDKARNGDETPRIALWYAVRAYQYLEGPTRTPRQYVSWSALGEHSA